MDEEEGQSLEKILGTGHVISLPPIPSPTPTKPRPMAL